MVDLSGRVAVVTGGGRGIGRAHCLELARRGAAVVVNDPGVDFDGAGLDAHPAEQVVADIRSSGGSAIADFGSVATAADADHLVAKAVSEFGQLDVVVNNAGILRQGELVDLTDDSFDSVLAVHVRGTFLVTRAAGRHWSGDNKESAHGRRIINTTSSAGMVGTAGAAAYAAAKAAVLGLTMTTAKEFTRLGATCNAISPVARTRMTDTFLPSSGDGWSVYDPANSSPVVAYLASREAEWLTGQVIRVQGNTVSRMHSWEVGEGYSGRTQDGPLDADELDVPLRQIFGVFPRDVFSVRGR